MKLQDLKPNAGSHRKRIRVGRGISAGRGKTAGRGTKGHDARAGGGKGPYFEGGQLPLVRRLPFKRGFTNLFRIVHQEVNLDKLAKVFKAGAEVTPNTLAAHRLIDDANKPVVILGGGDVKVALNVSAHRISKSAQAKIEAAGGKFTPLTLPVIGARATIKLVTKAARAKLAAGKAADKGDK
jgi:large subunit ribosomal protein L15